MPLAAVGLVAAAPLIAVAAAGILLTSGLPVFFRQTRVGRGGSLFTLVKLRSMRTSAAGARVTAGDDARVTAVGRVLRRTKLDELPELWNVLRGEMSFVGPRPEVPSLVEPAQPLWRAVLAVRPGLTDPVTLSLKDEEGMLAAVTGDRDVYYREVLQPQKLRGYVAYLARRTWATDLTVLAQTVAAILGIRRRAEGGPAS